MKQLELENKHYSKRKYRTIVGYIKPEKPKKLEISSLRYVQLSIGSCLTAYYLNGYDIGKLIHTLIQDDSFMYECFTSFLDVLSRAMYSDRRGNSVYGSRSYYLYAPYFNRMNRNNSIYALRVPGATIGFIKLDGTTVIEAEIYSDTVMYINVSKADKVLKGLIGHTVRIYESKS